MASSASLDLTGSILAETAAYYARKLAAHGPVAAGVDWRDETSQETRFAQLVRLFADDKAGSVADIGCGYGAFARYLRHHGFTGPYYGVDVAPEMLEAGRRFTQDLVDVSFLAETGVLPPADYIVASGIFNVRLGFKEMDWETHLFATIEKMNAVSRRGFAFNCLTSYSDPEKRRADLHYSDPLALFDWCKRHLSKNVALLHDYGLYEFTIIVRKSP